MPIYDITLPLSPLTFVFPGDPGVEVEPIRQITRGDPFNLVRLTLGSHAGTHIDPPFHLYDRGLKADQLPLGVLIGPARVVPVETTGPISRQDLEHRDLGESPRLLLRTGSSRRWRTWATEGRWAYLTLDAADRLIERRTRLIGIDAPSIDAPDAADLPVHRLLLQHGVLIVESLDLSIVTPGDYCLLCLPLKIEGGDGAPVRAVLSTP